MEKLKTFFVILLTTITGAVSAQKLPNIQKISLRTPANVKIDGKPTEWNNQFQAYNKATEVFYTIANDDDKLYLILKATDPTIIKKIVAGGVTFTINTTEKKSDKNAVSITFPVYDKNDPPYYLVLKDSPKQTADTEKNKMQTDSFRTALNLKLESKLKIIGVSGIKSITDGVVSIYNDEGIKAASLFDSQMHYICELALPLKDLELPAGKPLFSYQVRLNGASANNATIQTTSSGRFLIVTVPGNAPYAMPTGVPGITTMAYPTDFWGEYSLIDKN